MLKNYLRSTIIVLLQAILPIIALIMATPWLINQSTRLKDWQGFFTQNQLVFLMAHFVFYILLVVLWPKLVSMLKSEETNQQQYHLAMQARWYFAAIFMFFELILFIGVEH